MRLVPFAGFVFGIVLVSASAGAVPLTGVAQRAPAATSQSAVEDARYVTRCHTVMVKRWIRGYLRRVPVRRCGKVWVR
jgi:hypothetical protein